MQKSPQDTCEKRMVHDGMNKAWGSFKEEGRREASLSKGSSSRQPSGGTVGPGTLVAAGNGLRTGGGNK